MNCAQATELQDFYLDGELEPRLVSEVEAHLAGCAVCGGRMRAERRVRERIAALAGDEAAPPELRERIRARVRGSHPDVMALTPAAEIEQLEFSVEDLGPAAADEAAPAVHRDGSRPATPPRRHGLQIALAIAASLAALVLLWRVGPRGGAESVWAAGLADDHRAHHGASGQEYVVSESDPAALSRWFEQRLGARVPLPETPLGNRLVGGQICFVNGYEVAHAIYEREGTAGSEGAASALGAADLERAPGSTGAADPQVRTVSFYVLPRVAGPDGMTQGEIAGLNFVAWDSPPGGVFVLGAEPAAELAAFHPEVGPEGPVPES